MKTVLIVDDAAFMRLSLKIMLEKNGFLIVGEAENGEVAVEKYKECHPDLVTMDIIMPKMSGIAAVQIIKGYDQKAKIIMVSALGETGFLVKAIESGARHFIVKPFNEKHVVETINNVLAM